MIRKFVLAASAVAVVGGSVFAAVGSAGAAATPITAGAGSKISCSNIKTSVKVDPPLKDNWIKADHQATTGANAEPNSDVRGINNQTYAPNPPTHVTAKASSATCTGDSIAKQGSAVSHITKISVVLTDEAAHPTTDPGTCIGLVNANLGIGDPSTARYKVTIKYTAAHGEAKIAGTTITDAVIDNGFTVEGGTIAGSFAGSSNLKTTAGVDDATAGLFGQELAGPAPDGTTVANSTVNKGKAPNACQPGVKIVGSPTVPSKPHSATPLVPKGVKKIGINPATTTITGTR